MDPKLLPLVEAIGARYQSLTVDARLVNAYAEQGQSEGEVFVYKRPGFKLSSTISAGVARGLFNWNGDIYAVIGGSLYKNGASVGTVSNSGSYTFATTLGATPRLFLHNGTNAYTITAGGAFAAVADPDYPATTVGGSVYLDGTVYVMDATSHIYGSVGAGNDPTSWDPLNLILAQIESTPAVFLAKQLVYVIALKQWYSEAFYDAGNASGSPLAAVQGAKTNYGCVDGLTVRDVGGDLVWVSNTGEGFYTAAMLSSLKVEVISTPPIERLLSAGTVGNFMSWNVRVGGHRLYGVTNTAANWTLVYDVTSKMWYHWTDVNGNYLPYAYACQGPGATMNFLHATNGSIYTLDLATYKDGTDGPFPVTIYTPNFDGGTRRDKSLGRMDMLADQVATTVSVQYSDDDYATWNGNFIFDLSSARPMVSDLGAFRKRAFKFLHQDNTPFRVRGVELYVEPGVA